MIGNLVTAAREKASRVGWESLAPLCAAESCRRRTRWHGILRRSAGIRFEGGWFCGPDCLEEELETRLDTLLGQGRTLPDSPEHRVPLGLLLLSRGILQQQQLNEALRRHRESGERFGACVRRLGLASEKQITAALAAQWGCPVYSRGGAANCERLIPRLLQETHRMAPMHWVESGRCLFVGFEQKVEYTLLFAIEKMLDCHTEPCIVHESELNRILRENSAATGDEVLFASARTANEMAAAIASYAQQSEAERVKVGDCPEHIWVKFERNQSSLHLLFRKPG
jgi:hypothetical protein